MREVGDVHVHPYQLFRSSLGKVPISPAVKFDLNLYFES